LLLVADQEESLLLKEGRFTLRRDLVEQGEIAGAQAAFRQYRTARGLDRVRQRVNHYARRSAWSSHRSMYAN